MLLDLAKLEVIEFGPGDVNELWPTPSPRPPAFSIDTWQKDGSNNCYRCATNVRFGSNADIEAL